MWPTLKWSIAATVIGLAGLLLGGIAFPGSNLLGGVALVFGPIYWIGLLGLCAGGLVGVAELIAKAWR